MATGPAMLRVVRAEVIVMHALGIDERQCEGRTGAGDRGGT